MGDTFDKKKSETCTIQLEILKFMLNHLFSNKDIENISHRQEVSWDSTLKKTPVKIGQKKNKTKRIYMAEDKCKIENGTRTKEKG